MSIDQDVLRELRGRIDEVDTTLVRLLARRRELVTQVADLKREHGLPVYVPEREKSLIAERRHEAARHGVSPELIEDLLRRIMRESYMAEELSGFKRTLSKAAKVVIVGGGGGMGQAFGRLLKLSGYRIFNLEKNDWHQAASLLEDADLVLVSVPIDLTLSVLEKLEGLIPATCILADLTSIKAKPVEKMLAIHPGPVVGLHPMFGPATKSPAKQLIVVCKGRDHEQYQWLLDQFKLWGASLQVAKPEEHDQMMGFIQALRHFTTFVFGIHLCQEQLDLQKALHFSSPIYRLELGMVGRLFAQNPHLYAEIIFSSESGKAMARRLLGHFSRQLDILERGDKKAFEAEFKTVQAWFGDLSKQFLQESSYMIERVYEKSDRR